MKNCNTEAVIKRLHCQCKHKNFIIKELVNNLNNKPLLIVKSNIRKLSSLYPFILQKTL